MFQGRPTQKMAIFWPKKGPKFPILGKKAVFGAWVLSSRPPHPIFEVSDSKEHVLHGIEARKLVFQGRPPKKWAFFAQTWSKNVNIGPETLFFRLGRSFQGPPTLFFRCLTQKITSCIVWKPEKRYFRGASPTKMAIFCRKMA